MYAVLANGLRYMDLFIFGLLFQMVAVGSAWVSMKPEPGTPSWFQHGCQGPKHLDHLLSLSQEHHSGVVTSKAARI